MEGHYCQLFKLGHICGLHWLYLSITSQDNQLKTSPTELALKNLIQILLLTVSRAWLISYFLVSTHLPLELGHTGFLSAVKRPPLLGSSALARHLYRRLSSHLSGVSQMSLPQSAAILMTSPHPFLSFMSYMEQFISWLYICLLWLVLPTLHSGHVGFWKEKNLWALFTSSFPALWEHPV